MCRKNIIAACYIAIKKSQNVFGAIRVQFPKVLGTFDYNVIRRRYDESVSTFKNNFHIKTPPLKSEEGSFSVATKERHVKIIHEFL